MELEQAFDIVFNDAERKEALACIKCNHQKATITLIQKLQKICELYLSEINEENNELEKTLGLLAVLNATDAFPLFLKVIKFKEQCVSPDILGMFLFGVIPNENSISILKKYATNLAISEAGRLATCRAVILFYQHNENLHDLECFLKEVIFSLDLKQLDQFKDRLLLFNIIQNSINWGFVSLFERLKSLLIQLIIQSKHGNDDNYFNYLYKIDPLIQARLHKIKSYIRTLNRCTDKELFQPEDFASIGKFFFERTLGSLKTANVDMVKIAIKQLRQYPLNDRIQPSTEKEYYEDICFYLKMTKIPKVIYSQAKKLHHDIFETAYSSLIKRLEKLITETECEEKKLCEKSESIIAKSNGNHNIVNNVEEDIGYYKSQLVQNHLKIKELHSLYKKGSNSDCSGLLLYYLKQTEHLLDHFCTNADDPKQVDKKLRDLCGRCSFSADTLKIEDVFSQYQGALSQLDSLLKATPLSTLYNIFYTVKFLPFRKNILKRYCETENLSKTDVQYRFTQELEGHPLFPQSSMDCANKDIHQYCNMLEIILPTVVSSIREALENSICLNRRKLLIERCLQLVENTKNDELILNLLPVQIEGLFADLLEYTTIFECIDDIRLYQKMLNLELSQKVDFGTSKNINLSLSTIAYFKYYFNSVVRNTVAHGNYALLVENREAHTKDCDSTNKTDLIKRLLTLEMLLDLNYLINTICDTNELDTANKYIKDTAHKLEDNKDNYYDCLFADLNGTRNRFNLSGYIPGVFITYEPMQIIHWIFNPYYEKYLDTTNLKLIRQCICSSKFWMYVENQLEENRNSRLNTKNFSSLVKKMIGIVTQPSQHDPETRAVLININKKLHV